MSAYDLYKMETDDDLRAARQALAACAYWAANGLREHADYDSSSVDKHLVAHTMLENILKESKEYAEFGPGRDSNVTFEGKEYSYTPVGGWSEWEKEKK